ncbi:hypothetical protein DPMN_018512 [Dreissena polymorpha]|uniref:Uncharacterized protein n=1 Tax=Dreissena polymorpha TaxID=45954 RepID=A0A9D4NHE7_DREPO|nr:hypothetical protein DPMN_018512 [Dreissena polymorpha]
MTKHNKTSQTSIVISQSCDQPSPVARHVVWPAKSCDQPTKSCDQTSHSCDQTTKSCDQPSPSCDKPILFQAKSCDQPNQPSPSSPVTIQSLDQPSPVISQRSLVSYDQSSLVANQFKSCHQTSPSCDQPILFQAKSCDQPTKSCDQQTKSCDQSTKSCDTPSIFTSHVL